MKTHKLTDEEREQGLARMKTGKPPGIEVTCEGDTGDGPCGPCTDWRNGTCGRDHPLEVIDDEENNRAPILFSGAVAYIISDFCNDARGRLFVQRLGRASLSRLEIAHTILALKEILLTE